MKYFNKTNILPGSMFTVKPNDIKEMQFSNGSKGYFSYILGTNDDNPNIIYNNIVLTKKGMKGKDRLTTGTLITAFYTCNDEEVNELILNKDYQYIPVTTHDIPLTSIHLFHPVEFFGWILSNTQLHRKLDGKNHDLFLNNINHDNMGKHLFIFEYSNLLTEFNQDIESLFDTDNMTNVMSKFFTYENRNKLIYELRRQNSLFMLSYNDYILNLCSIENTALSYMKNIIETSNIKNKELYIKEIVSLQLITRQKRDNISSKITSKLNTLRNLHVNYQLL